MVIHALQRKCKWEFEENKKKYHKNYFGVLSTKSEADIKNRLFSKEARNGTAYLDIY